MRAAFRFRSGHPLQWSAYLAMPVRLRCLRLQWPRNLLAPQALASYFVPFPLLSLTQVERTVFHHALLSLALLEKE